MADFRAGNIIAKTVGAAGLGLVLWDAHNAAKIRSKMTETNIKTDSLERNFNNNTKLDSPSVVKSATKNRILRYNMDEHISGFFTNIYGYARGFGSMLVNEAIPFGLSIGTLCTKGKVSKFFGAGLLAYGAIYLLQEIFGIGKTKE